MNWIPKITSVNKMYNTSFRFIYFFAVLIFLMSSSVGYSDSDEGVAEAQTYYQNNKFDSPGYTPPSQDNNQIIDTNSSTTSLKSTGNSSSNTGSGFNQQTVQGYATAAQQVAAASQSSSSTGQVLGYTGGVLTATGTAMVAETFGTAQYGYYLILAGTLSSIAGGVASDQGSDLGKLHNGITDTPDYQNPYTTNPGNCSGGIYDYADGCIPTGSTTTNIPGLGNPEWEKNPHENNNHTTTTTATDIKIPSIFNGTNLSIQQKTKIKDQFDKLKDQGITYNEDKKGFDTPSGFIPNSSLNDPNKLKNAISQIPDGPLKDKVLDAKAQMEGIAANVASVSFNNPGGGGSNSSGKKSADGSKLTFDMGGSSLYQSLMDKYNKKNQSRLPAATSEGKTVLLGGSIPVGVVGDNIFDMVHRRYFKLGVLNELDP